MCRLRIDVNQTPQVHVHPHSGRPSNSTGGAEDTAYLISPFFFDLGVAAAVAARKRKLKGKQRGKSVRVPSTSPQPLRQKLEEYEDTAIALRLLSPARCPLPSWTLTPLFTILTCLLLPHLASPYLCGAYLCGRNVALQRYSFVTAAAMAILLALNQPRRSVSTCVTRPLFLPGRGREWPTLVTREACNTIGSCWQGL